MPSTTRRRLGAVCGSVILAVAMSFFGISSAEATEKLCQVKNTTQNTWFATHSGLALSHALATAEPGDRLAVIGTCRGAFLVTVDLTIVGSSDGTTTLRGTGVGAILSTASDTTVRLLRLRLSGNTAGGLVVAEGSNVTLSHSRVTRNSSSRAGGGIQNGGNLTVNYSLILRNHTASDGGGIFNFGDLVVNASIINNNVADGVGGGLFTEGVATLNRSRVRFNEAASGGGIRAVNVLTLNETIVSDNIPDDCC